MITYEKPIFQEEDIWCNSPDNPDSINPPDDNKKSIGWLFGEIPPHNFANWQDNIESHYFVYLNQHGIPEWDSNISYTKGAIVVDGSIVYTSLYDNNLGILPGTDPSAWRTNHTKLSDYFDTDIQSPNDGDIIVYRESDNKWANVVVTTDLYFEKHENDYLGIYNILKPITNKDILNNIQKNIEFGLIMFTENSIFEVKDIKVNYSEIKDNIILDEKMFKKSSKEYYGLFHTKETSLGFEINTIQEYEEEIQYNQINYTNNVVFTKDDTWTVPAGITQITVHVVGGGGSGSIGKDIQKTYGGGEAGQYIYQTYNVQENDVIDIFIGSGGVVPQSEGNGFNGTNSSINISGSITETLIAGGGIGGKIDQDSYNGDGNIVTNNYTGDIYYDGIFVGFDINCGCNIKWISYWDKWINGYGGQASAFSNGGSRSGVVPMFGAGGASTHVSGTFLDNELFCRGADGVVVIEY